MSKLITLEEWARRRYEKPPHIKTVRRWQKEGKIYPAPKKEGRAYVVSETAEYIDWSDPNAHELAARALSEPAETQRG